MKLFKDKKYILPNYTKANIFIKNTFKLNLSSNSENDFSIYLSKSAKKAQRIHEEQLFRFYFEKLAENYTKENNNNNSRVEDRIENLFKNSIMFKISDLPYPNQEIIFSQNQNQKENIQDNFSIIDSNNPNLIYSQIIRAPFKINLQNSNLKSKKLKLRNIDDVIPNSNRSLYPDLKLILFTMTNLNYSIFHQIKTNSKLDSNYLKLDKILIKFNQTNYARTIDDEITIRYSNPILENQRRDLLEEYKIEFNANIGHKQILMGHKTYTRYLNYDTLSVVDPEFNKRILMQSCLDEIQNGPKL